jgi:hypothetical protein
MPSNNHTKKPGGRPRKHTAAAAIEAKKQSDRRRYLRSLQAQGPADFIQFEPRQPDIPNDTPPAIGLRTNIQIPQDHDVQPDDAQPSEALPSSAAPCPQLNTPPPTQLPISDEDAKIAGQIEQARADEQETNLERREYEAEITRHMTAAAEILLGIRSANTSDGVEVPVDEISESQEVGEIADSMVQPDLQTIERTETATVRERASEEESQRSCFSNLSFKDGPIMWDNDSVIASDPSNRLADIDRSRENTVLSQAQRSPPLFQPSSRSTTSGRQSKSFPAQNNDLLSWMNPLPSRSSVSSNDSTPARQRRRSDASSAQLVIQTPAAANATPAAYVPPAPSPPPEPATIPSPAAPRDASASPAPRERTALKLAKQLRNFQGCTHEQHREADQLHQEHHRRPDVHSECSSLQQITEIIRGNNRDTPLPDVLSSSKLMKPADINGLDCRTAFEGSDAPTAPDGAEVRDEYLPRNLCLSQCHNASKKNRRAEVTFDIDSTCCFANSLGVARLGINWFPKAHAVLNLTADIHFGLKVLTYNKRGVLIQQYTPLHKIPHYCFGTVTGMESLFILIFFPALHTESDYEHSTHLSKQDQELCVDLV